MSPLQSPVSHLPRPAPSKEQPVRPQTRAPVVPGAGFMVHVWPELSFVPPPGTAAAQMVKGQLFRMSIVASAAWFENKAMRRKVNAKGEIV